MHMLCGAGTRERDPFVWMDGWMDMGRWEDGMKEKKCRYYEMRE
jgi:hypothetical protein